MNKYARLGGACLLAHCAGFTAASYAAPLAAVMTFDSMTITADGVTKQTHFQEQFIRDAEVVWSQRIIPTPAAHADDHDHSADPHEHKHNLNFATAGKWLVRDGGDKIRFRLVRQTDNTIVAPRESDYGTLGFDGVWETAYYLVDRAALKKMTRLNTATPKGAQWYEQRNEHLFTRILWDHAHEIPLTIETGAHDGSSRSTISLKLTPAPSSLPWAKLGSFNTIAYEDLLD